MARPLILHDNDCLHIADLVTKKLRDCGWWEALPHVPYIPDMSPPDFDLFPNLKEPQAEIGASQQNLSEATLMT